MNSLNDRILLEVKNLKMYFPIQSGFFRSVTGYVRAVDDISLKIQKGETLSLVGESGCGKTTTARCILRAYIPTSGEILFQDTSGEMVNITSLSKQDLQPYRRKIQMIFQDPYSSLNPRMTLFDIVGEPLLVHGMRDRQERMDRVTDLLQMVGLRPEYLERYPHAFSGGQRQRIGIARALALGPDLIVADEPVSALDVSVQAQILNLLIELQEHLNLTLLFVAHDLSVVKHVSDRVAVMYVGRIVELASTENLFNHPMHPYTEALLSAVPRPDPRYRSTRIHLEGDAADAASPPPGCYFHPRCRYAVDVCSKETPKLDEALPDHFVSCHRASELDLLGINDRAENT
ncbi:MAG: ATP-binding cassette domain-containing protein [Anaerolineales bacterium]|jgi:peptide/nickel transport system ATP-binding protein